MYEQISENKRNTIILIAVFSVIIVALAWVLGEYIFGIGSFGLALGGLFRSIYSLVNYFFADRIVLAISGARELQKNEHPYLFNLIEGLAIAAGIPKRSEE